MDKKLSEVDTPPKVVNIKNENVDYDPGNPNHVYIGRRNNRYGLPQSKWANPYKLSDGYSREDALTLYRQYILNKPGLLEDLPELMGKTLFCWCKPKACHGDVLAELATLDSFKENREGGR